MHYVCVTNGQLYRLPSALLVCGVGCVERHHIWLLAHARCLCFAAPTLDHDWLLVPGAVCRRLLWSRSEMMSGTRWWS